MSTLVVVEKDGVACMAADTLTTFGYGKQPARYVSDPDKILRVDDAYLGFVGWAVSKTILESVLASGFELPAIRTELELFEFARKLHRKLKKKYFLSSPSHEDGFESSHMTMFLMNEHGIFGLHEDRAVERYARFFAVGSGWRYALGAMHATYDQELGADEIARAGVEAGIEFDAASAAPITLKKVKRVREK